MPELPEVETTLRGVLPHLAGQKVADVIVREPRLRQPVPNSIRQLKGKRILDGRRRAKYLLFSAEAEHTLLIHLGMSGSLRLTDSETPPRKHDHVILQLESGAQLRYHDPRRFGCVLWLQEVQPEASHPLLRSLGPEPLDTAFCGQYLFRRSRGRSLAVKNFIMDAAVVVGVGNIYACESLFLAGVHPARPAGKVSAAAYTRLAQAISTVLQESIRMGGTTLRDFVREDGQPGYFKQSLRVYGRYGEPCPACDTAVSKSVLGQRTTFFCPRCQK